MVLVLVAYLMKSITPLHVPWASPGSPPSGIFYLCLCFDSPGFPSLFNTFMPLPSNMDESTTNSKA